jgi:hypothetical protein
MRNLRSSPKSKPNGAVNLWAEAAATCLSAGAKHLFPILLYCDITNLSARKLLGMTAEIQIFVSPDAWLIFYSCGRHVCGNLFILFKWRGDFRKSVVPRHM